MTHFENQLLSSQWYKSVREIVPETNLFDTQFVHVERGLNILLLLEI